MRVVIRATIMAYLVVNSVFAAERIEVFPLKSRLAQELIPVLEPLAGSESTITGMGDKLIVKADEAQLQQIRQLLGELDRPPKRLLIEVRHSAEIQRNANSGRLRARIEKDRANITLGHRRPEGLDVRIRSTNTRRDTDFLQRIQTLEGRAAYIATGQSVPIHEPSVQVHGNRVYAQDRVYYRDATTGFYVIPWIHGESVTLTLNQHADQSGTGDQQLTLQHAETSLSGQLGEWLVVGGSQESGSNRTTGLDKMTRTRDRDERHIELRVTEVN